MMSPAESYSYQSENENSSSVLWLAAIVITFPLTLLAALLWSGLALAGVALLALAFALLVVSLLSHYYYERPAWGTAVAGQLIGLGGVALLFLASLL